MFVRTRSLALLLTSLSIFGLGCLPVVAAGVVGLIEALDSNATPSVIVTTPERSVDETVEVDVRVFDADGDTVSLEVSYRLDALSPWQPATISPTEVAASAGGTEHTLVWEAFEDLGDQPGEDNYRDGLQLRIVPDDGRARGEAVRSDPFAFGNDAPFITTAPGMEHPLRIDANTDFHTDLIVIWFDVADTAGDAVRVVSFEVSTTGGFDPQADEIFVVDQPYTKTGLGNTFPGGNLTGLVSEINAYGDGSDAGTPAGITWDSRETLERTTDDAVIRLQLEDEHGARSEFYESPRFSLINQTPPQSILIETVQPGLGGERPGAVFIDYLLFDEESDTSDILVEYSTDNGKNWLPCTEYPGLGSEGRYDLASSPDGVEHRFVWDAPIDLVGLHSNVSIRITPADDFHPEEGLADWTIAGFAVGASRFERFDFNSPNFFGAEQQMLAAAFNHTEPNAHDLIRTDNGIMQFYPGGEFFTPEVGFAIDDPTAEIYTVHHLFALDTTQDAEKDTLFIMFEEQGSSGLYLGRAEREPFNPFTGQGPFGSWEIDSISGHDVVDVAVGRLGLGDPTEYDLVFADEQGSLWGLADATFLDQPLGSPQQLTGFTGEARYVALADVLSGGELDLVVIDPASEALTIAAGDGTGGFEWGTATEHSLGFLPGPVTLADMTNNGELDLLIAGSRIGIALTEGGSVAPPIESDTKDTAHILAHDINGNGRRDLIASRGSGENLLLMATDGHGEITATATLGIETPSRGVVANDFTGNGAPDIVAASDERVTFHRGVTYLRYLDGELTNLESTIRGVTSGDFARTGHTDLMLTKDGKGWILHGGRNGQFHTEAFTLANDYAFLASADIDGDGTIEVIGGHAPETGEHALYRLTPDGEGGFNETLIETMPTGSELAALELADMTGSGFPDLVYALNHSEDSELRLRQNNNGSLASQEMIVPVSDRTASHQLALANLLGDDTLEVVLGTELGDVYVFASVELMPVQIFSDGATAVSAMATGDITGNGRIDLTYALEGDNTLYLEENQGFGSFSARHFSGLLTNLSVSDVGLADLNEDGRLDILLRAHDGSDHGLIGVFGVGTQATSARPIASLPAANHFLLGDFANNGVPDVVIVDDGGVLMVRGNRMLGSWSHLLEEADVLGADTLPAGNDRFGNEREHSLGLRRFRGYDTSAPAEMSAGSTALQPDFTSLLHNARLNHIDVSDMVPYTDAWVISGIQRLHRRPDASEPFEFVLQVSNRFGPLLDPEETTMRKGLDLDPEPSEPLRGVIVEIPIEFDGSAMGDPTVVQRSVDWAVDENNEFEFTDVEGQRRHHAYAEGYTWRRILSATDDTFGIDDGPRYIVDQQAGVLRILTDRDGIIQVFIEEAPTN